MNGFPALELAIWFVSIVSLTVVIAVGGILYATTRSLKHLSEEMEKSLWSE